MNGNVLHAHRFLLRAGLAIANTFAWIFVFEYFYLLSSSVPRSLAGVTLLYALSQFIIIVATPISASHLRRGVRHSIIWGVVLGASAFVVLGSTFGGYFNASPVWGAAVFAILLGSYRALYWVPYKLAQTAIEPHLHMRSYLEVLVALLPLFAGFTLVSIEFAPLRLLFGAAALIVCSAVPILFLSETREKFSWTYAYTFRQFWRRRNHGLVLQSLFDGIQGASLFLIWPLAIFLIVDWSYLALGLVFSLTLLFILLLRRAYAWIQGLLGLRDSGLVYVVVAVSAWIARLAAGTPIGIIVADVYSYTTQPERGTRGDPFSFEQVSDRGAFVDEYTVLKEISLAGGRIMLCATTFFLIFIFSLPLVFAIVLGIAAAASAFSILIARRQTRASY